MRSGAEIAAQIKSKMAETAKNEVIALSEEEFIEFVSNEHCPSMFGLHEISNTNFKFPECLIGIRRKDCTECWKKATGRK